MTETRPEKKISEYEPDDKLRAFNETQFNLIRETYAKDVQDIAKSKKLPGTVDLKDGRQLKRFYAKAGSNNNIRILSTICSNLDISIHEPEGRLGKLGPAWYEYPTLIKFGGPIIIGSNALGAHDTCFMDEVRKSRRPYKGVPAWDFKGNLKQLSLVVDLNELSDEDKLPEIRVLSLPYNMAEGLFLLAKEQKKDITCLHSGVEVKFTKNEGGYSDFVLGSRFSLPKMDIPSLIRETEVPSFSKNKDIVNRYLDKRIKG